MPLRTLLAASTVATLGYSLVVGAAPAHAADAWQPETPNCGDLSTTYEIADCLHRRAEVWDRRLNQAYQALMKMLASMGDEGQAQQRQLRTAQRLWLQYRTANCGFYAEEGGTIRSIDAAECMRSMTESRAIELQHAGPQ